MCRQGVQQLQMSCVKQTKLLHLHIVEYCTVCTLIHLLTAAGDCYLEYDRVTGRYLDANQPVQGRNVLEAFVDPNEADRSQLQLPQPTPNMVLEPSPPVSVELERASHVPETVRRHKDSSEVSWQDLEPQPDDQIRQYVGGRTA